MSVPRLTPPVDVFAIQRLCEPAPPLAVIVPVVTAVPDVAPLDKNTGPPKKTPVALVLMLPKLSAPCAITTTAFPCPEVVTLVFILPVVMPPLVPMLTR